MIKHLVCPVCGKIFYQEYYEGGYIDHMNFANNLGIMYKRYNAGDKNAFDELIKDGNDIREPENIKAQLKCAKVYFKDNKKIIKHLETLANNQLNHIRKLNIIREQILDLVKDLNGADKEYIGLNYQAY